MSTAHLQAQLLYKHVYEHSPLNKHCSSTLKAISCITSNQAPRCRLSPPIHPFVTPLLDPVTPLLPLALPEADPPGFILHFASAYLIE